MSMTGSRLPPRVAGQPRIRAGRRPRSWVSYEVEDDEGRTSAPNSARFGAAVVIANEPEARRRGHREFFVQSAASSSSFRSHERFSHLLRGSCASSAVRNVARTRFSSPQQSSRTADSSTTPLRSVASAGSPQVRYCKSCSIASESTRGSTNYYGLDDAPDAWKVTARDGTRIRQESSSGCRFREHGASDVAE